MLINLQLQALAASLGNELKVRRAAITTVESCTGGAIAAALTAVAGSSAWFEMSIVSYSNSVKQRVLGVPSQFFESDGAVSEAVVMAMLDGGIRCSGADFGIAVSGIAGPDGGTIGKPVGTVWLATGTTLAKQTHCCHFHGDRDAIREQAVIYALTSALAHLKQVL